ncbi:uncharacterized protein BDV17DRAFT_293260 [Aspergillus undulatus]|uniref:uncharacterized protein n=1 Tax=Aspergillus undulatus TaxID=1810928 RepID=UPI003CCD61D8
MFRFVELTLPLEKPAGNEIVPLAVSTYGAHKGEHGEPTNNEGIRLTIFEPAVGNHTHTVILFHDLDSSGTQFGEELIREFIKLRHFPATKFIFPSARAQKEEESWLNIASSSNTNPDSTIQDKIKGLEEKSQIHTQLHGRRNTKARCRRYSYQERRLRSHCPVRARPGLCAAAIMNFLAGNKQLGGFIGMSGYIPLEEELLEIFNKKPTDISVWIQSQHASTRLTFRPLPLTPQHNAPAEQEAIDLTCGILDREHMNIDACTCEILYVIDPGRTGAVRLNGNAPSISILGLQEAHRLYTSFFLGHGDADDVVSVKRSRNMRTVLADWDHLGMPVTYKEYQGLGDGYKSPEVIREIVSFLVREVGFPPLTHFDELKEMKEERAAYLEAEGDDKDETELKTGGWRLFLRAGRDTFSSSESTSYKKTTSLQHHQNYYTSRIHTFTTPRGVRLHPRQNRPFRAHPPLIVNPIGDNHTQTIILLHGFGTNGQLLGQEFLALTSLSTEFPSVKFIFPSGLRIRMTMWKCAWTKCWFDMASLGDTNLRSEIQVPVLKGTAGYIRETIDEEARLLALSGQAILGGISEGCAAAIFALLGSDKELGGFIVMSGWMPFQSELEAMLKTSDEEDDLFEAYEGEEVEQNAHTVDGYPDFSSRSWHGRHILNTPLFVGHGDEDGPVSIESGRKMETILGDADKGLAIPVTWEEYEGFGHGYNTPNIIDDIASYLVNGLNVPYSADLEELDNSDADATSDAEGEVVDESSADKDDSFDHLYVDLLSLFYCHDRD